MMELFLINLQLFTSQDSNWWTGVMWITCGSLWCFISCLNSHSDGTHSLQRINLQTRDVMLNYLKSQNGVFTVCHNLSEFHQTITSFHIFVTLPPTPTVTFSTIASCTFYFEVEAGFNRSLYLKAHRFKFGWKPPADFNMQWVRGILGEKWKCTESRDLWGKSAT